jgi:hypothetical protein
MCLIIHSPHGKAIPDDHFNAGARDNDDGIGIMSTDGIAKFVGKRRTKKARRYARRLAEAGIPFAVHFRWATHGRVGRANTHPFEIPGTDVYMMHNGVLWTAKDATDDESDTAIFARAVMPEYLQLSDTDPQWKAQLELESSYSKLLLMNAVTGEWDIVNEYLGDWLGGLWYSNLYSVPWKDLPYKLQKAHSKKYFSSALTGNTNLTATTSYALPSLPSGPTLRTGDDSDELEDWYYQARARQARRDRGGFDWHDRDTWDRYPIPGSWDDRFPPSDEIQGLSNPDDDDDVMDGVQSYV